MKRGWGEFITGTKTVHYNRKPLSFCALCHRAFFQDISGKNLQPEYGPERPGDVKHSRADIAKIERLLAYKPKVRFEEGLERVYEWYENSK